MSSFLVTPPGILSFPALFTAKSAVPGAEPRFSAVVIFDAAAQATDEYKKLKLAVAEVAKSEFGDKVNFSQLKLPFRDGAEKEYNGYGAGKVFISAWTKSRPGIIDTEGNEIIDPSLIWAGQTVQLSVSPFAYSQSGNKGVSFGLRNVLLVNSDGERLDGRAPAKNDFAGVAGFSAKSTAAAEDLPF